MALQGKFILNGADYAPFNLYGVGVFMAFSGNGIYRNKGACGAIPNDGPLPQGKYWIVERGSGGLGSWAKAVSLQYEKITWRIVDGNIQYTDSWNERPTA
ncbi:type VI secretion protein [Escherichia coli]|nr:type VI secretion protein [Escherichia coli]